MIIKPFCGCLKRSLPHLNMKNVKAEKFDGYNSLRSADKKKLRETLGEAEETDTADAGKRKGFVMIKNMYYLMDILCRRKQKGRAEDGPADKKQKQENAEEMALKVSS